MGGIKSIVISVMLIVLVLMFFLVLVGGYSNKIRDLMIVINGASIVLALFRPKVAFILLVVATGYLDLVKRFLMLDASVSFNDVYYVLGYAPVTLLVICISVFFRAFMHRQLTWQYGKLILLSVVLFGAIAGLILSQQGMSAIGYVAQAASFVVLLFCVPMLFKNSDEIIKLLKIIVLLFIPVAAYSIYQFYAGLSNFEMAYLESGFTGETRHLERGAGSKIYRLNFSTLNSTVAVSAILCILAFVVVPPLVRRSRVDMPLLSGLFGFKGVLIFLLFVFAAYLTFTRAGWFGGIVCVIAWLCIRKKITVCLMYSFTILGVLALFIFPYEIEQEFKAGLFGLGDNSEADVMVLTTSTWQARLLGFKNLQDDPSLWTPFGLKSDGINLDDDEWEQMTHDLITGIILKYGLVPSVFLLCVLGYALYKMHTTYFSITDEKLKRLLLILLAAIIGNLSAGLTNYSALTIYPLNFYLWFFVGSCFTVIFEQQRASSAGKLTGARV